MTSEALPTAPSAAARPITHPASPRFSPDLRGFLREACLRRGSTLALVIDYANGMTQAEIAKKHGSMYRLCGSGYRRLASRLVPGSGF